MVQGDVGIVLGYVYDGATPQTGRSQDVGFIDGRDLAAPFPRRFHGKARNALYFGHAVVFQIPGPFNAVVDF